MKDNSVPSNQLWVADYDTGGIRVNRTQPLERTHSISRDLELRHFFYPVNLLFHSGFHSPLI